MEILIPVIIIGPSSVFLLVTILNVIFGPYLKNSESIKTGPFVSVLIPARNEEENIRRCLNGILNQDYQNYEVIVLDDNSEDKTYSILQEYTKNKRLKVMKGKEIPFDWNGKPWACRQLSEAASGEILIFTDADVWHTPDAIGKTVGIMLNKNADLVSAAPEQVNITLPEKLFSIFPDILLYSLLPIILIFYSSWKILSATHGNWIAVKADVYKKTGGHSSIKNDIVEDMALGRLFKAKMYKTLMTSGIGIIYTRMYKSFDEIKHGYGKNAYALAGAKPVIFILFLTLLVISSILPYIFIVLDIYYNYSLTVIILNLLWRGIMALRFRHDMTSALLFHPVSIGVMIYISLYSYVNFKRKRLVWKGRTLNT